VQREGIARLCERERLELLETIPEMDVPAASRSSSEPG
jgi:hypothetical protein